MARTFQTPETTDLIVLFPEHFPNSRTMADLEAQWEADAEYEHQLERHIAANYGDCGHPFGYLQNAWEDEAERMAEAYDPGLNHF